MSVIFGPGIGMQPAQGSLVDDTNAVDQAPVVVQATDTQSGNLMEFRSPSGTLLSAVDVNGAMGGGAGLAGAVILAPTTSARNVIQPTADALTGLTVRRHSAAGSAVALFQVEEETGNPVCYVTDGQLDSVLNVIGKAENTTVLVGGFADQLSPLGYWQANSAVATSKGAFVIDHDGSLTLQKGDTVDIETVGSIVQSFADSTHATRKGRVVVSVFDTAKREGLRLEASGTAPMIGFLGANAVVRQTNGTAADLAAIADAPAKAFITALSTALVNLGLLAAPA